MHVGTGVVYNSGCFFCDREAKNPIRCALKVIQLYCPSMDTSATVDKLISHINRATAGLFNIDKEYFIHTAPVVSRTLSLMNMHTSTAHAFHSVDFLQWLLVGIFSSLVTVILHVKVFVYTHSHCYFTCYLVYRITDAQSFDAIVSF